MKNLTKVDVSNILKKDEPKGLQLLINSLIKVQRTVQVLNLSQNKGINSQNTFDSLKKLIATSTPLKSLDISTMGMNAKYCVQLLKFLNGELGKDWNLNNGLKELKWDNDLKEIESLKKIASQFLEKELVMVYNRKICHIQMCGVFDKPEERERISKKLKQHNVSSKLVDI